MREIKFRVWTGIEMEYRVMAGFLGHFYVQGMSDTDTACMSPFNTKYYPETILMQYTGHKDKNGKEIYEGDQINVSGLLYTVIYSLEDSGFIGEYHHSEDPESLPVSCLTDGEVIGNIYQS